MLAVAHPLLWPPCVGCILQTRARVAGLKCRLDTGLAALQASVDGNSAFAAGHLRELGAMCQPLLASPISGEGAWERQPLLSTSGCLW